jgi:hypothetical protein
MKSKQTCPLGFECEEVKDNQIYKCRWYVSLKGKDPQSEEIIDNWNCAMAWIPILLVENSQTNRGQTQAIESFRNETIKGQNVFTFLMNKALNNRKISEK